MAATAMGDKKSSGPASVETALESLQPIRDLAKNWDIDIAACLEEYLQDLLGDLTEEQRRNLPSHSDSLNFSQAALVLQNSSNVYSRKVEYLYNLVNQVHEELLSSAGATGSAAGKKTARKASGDAEIEEFSVFDQNIDFLLLDDVLPTDEKGDKINLKEDKSNNLGRESGFGASFATTSTRLSLGATLAGASRLDRSAVSATSQAAAHQLVAGSLDAGSLRLIDGRCDVGEDGIMILPGAGGTAEGKLRGTSLFGNFSPRVSVGEDPATKETVDFGLGDNYDDDNEDYNCGLQFANDCEPMDENPQMEEESGTTKENINNQSTPMRAKSAKADKSAKEQKPDPWTLLDPHSHEASNTKIRPLRVAKTFKVPSAVSDIPSKAVTGASTKCGTQTKTTASRSQRQPRKSFDSLASATFQAKLSSERRQKNSKTLDDSDAIFSSLPSKPLKGLAFGDEFLYIARAVAKQMNALRREEQNKKVVGEEADQERHQERHYAFPEDDDEGYAAPDLGGDDASDDVGGGYDDDDDAGNAGFDLMEAMINADKTGGQTFEELCRAHIQAFAKGAEAFATETGLSKRVGNWHDRLAPILEEEETRPEFDIHAYTKRVVAAIVGKGDDECRNTVADFSKVTQNCPRFEVCRLFLATLSLANSKNVKLELDEDQSTFRIEVIDKTIKNPMETYLAPSLAEEE